VVEIITALNALSGRETSAELLAERTRLLDSSEVLDNTLIGYVSSWPHNLTTTTYMLAQSRRARFLMAFRPGVMHPTVAARTTATMAALSGGRLTLNIVIGGSEKETLCEGDFLDKPARYARAGEYVSLMKRIWTDPDEFDFDGEFYQAKHIRQLIRPPGGHIPIYMAGESAEALRFGAEHADVYMLWGEPHAPTRDRIARIRDAAAAFGRKPDIALTLRLYLGDTDDDAWAVAHDALAQVSATAKGGPRWHTTAEGQRRQYELATERETYDDCFWTGITRAVGGVGNSAALVGTPDRVLASLREYADAGVTGFMLTTGPHGLWDPSLETFCRRVKTELPTLVGTT
jgi:alkanesulfonate monooxygenase